MMHTMWNLAAWVLVLGAATGAGHLIFRWIRVPTSPLMDTTLVSFALGMGLLAVGVAGLGWLHLFQPTTILGWFAIVGVLAISEVWHVRKAGFRFAGRKPQSLEHSVYPIRWLLAFAGVFAVVFLLSTMAPPLDGDTLHSYLDVPRQFLEAGGIIPLPYELLSHLPLNIQMLSILALTLAGDELAQMLAGFTMAAAGALVVFALGRRYVSMEVGILAALIFLSMDVTQSLVPTAKVNLGWAFLDLLAVYAIARWSLETPHEQRWLLLAGVLSGLALGTFYSSAFTVLLLGMGIVVMSWKMGAARVLRNTMIYGVPVLLLGAPWLARNWMDVVNPVFPVLNPLFGIPPMELVSYGANHPIGVLTAPWEMATGFIAGPFSSPIGPVVLGAVPGLLLVRPIPHKVMAALLFCVMWYLLWYAGVQRERNLLTVLGLLSIVSAYGYVELAQRSQLMKRGVVVLLTAFLVFNLVNYARVYFVNLNYGKYLAGMETREQFLERNLRHPAFPTWPMLEHMKTLSGEARIVSMYIGNGYYVTRPFIDSRMTDGVFSVDTAKDPKQLLQQWDNAGITHVFISYAALEGKEWPSDWSIVRNPAFQERCLEEVFADAGQHLYELACPWQETVSAVSLHTVKAFMSASSGDL